MAKNQNFTKIAHRYSQKNKMTMHIDSQLQ